MSELPTKFKGGWKYPQMLETAKKHVEEKYEKASKQELKDKLAEVLAAANGIHHTLSALDSRGIGNGYRHGSTWASSDLFPTDLAEEGQSGEGKVFITKWYPKEEGKQPNCYFEPQDPLWDGTQDINHEESLSIPCTTYVADEVTILATHENAMACYISGGSITFGDVRILGKVLYETDCVLLDSLKDENVEQNNNVEPNAHSEGIDTKESNS